MAIWLDADHRAYMRLGFDAAGIAAAAEAAQ